MSPLLAGRPALSIVVPVYDEEDSVQRLYEAIRRACTPLSLAFEIVFIDDGSRDRTFEVLDALHRGDGRVRVIRFRKNYGQTAAMTAGFRAARGAVVVSMDGDLQNDPADIPRLLAKLDEGYDVVCGWRKHRQDRLLSRRLPSAVANRLIALLTGVRIHDNGCSLKAYRASVVKQLGLYSEFHRFIPAMSTLLGSRIAEIVVQHHARRFGHSKYGISRVWRVLLDLVVIKMLTGFSRRPARWFGLLSLPPLALGVACTLATVIASKPSMIVPTSGFLGFALAGHLLMVGTLGELILRTGQDNGKRPFARSVHTYP